MIALIVHGGAWNIPDEALEAHRRGCSAALEKGWSVLSSGGSAVDAIEQTIRVLEDDGTFDAGKGSHFNAIGEVELDASIMNGKTYRCGAVAAVRHIRNPISLARKVMDDSEHILLVGQGAETFARENGIELCQQEELRSRREYELWRSVHERDRFHTSDEFESHSRDTVGAVALDNEGVLCVGTSTGGTLHKHPGRVGDSPLIGCGSYADSAIGGVSTTGWGEGMIKVVMAKSVVDALDRNGGNPQQAAERGIELLQRKVSGHGGVIVLSASGEFGVAFNTPRMARGYRSSRMAAAVVEV